MTQSTLRFLIGGLLTVGLLSSLARGDDKARPPEVLPMPHCAACEQAADCCSPNAPCCQAGSECCAKTNAKAPRFSVVAMPAGVDFKQSWGASSRAEQVKKWQIAELMTLYHSLYKEKKYRDAEICAIKAQELDPENFVLAAAVREAHLAVAHQEYQDIVNDREESYRVTRGGGAEKVTAADVSGSRNPRDPGEAESRIRRKLDAPVTGFDYRDTPLIQVLDDLAGWSQINIVPDVPALKAANITLGQMITLKLDGSNLKTALRLLLHPAQLTYQVSNDAIIITTKDSKLGKFERRVFPVLDLTIPDSGSLSTFLSMLRENKSEQQHDLLIKFIQDIVEPETWTKCGGLGTIEFFPLGKALVISQTPEVQDEVQKLLNALRLAQESQVADTKAEICQTAASDVVDNTPKERAGSKLDRRVYPAVDLISPSVLQVAGIGQKGTQNRTLEDILIKLIRETIEPKSWRAAGGTGTIEFSPLEMALVVNQTVDIQAQVQEMINALRRVQESLVAKVKGNCPPNNAAKPAPASCEIMTVGAQFNQLFDPASDGRHELDFGVLPSIRSGDARLNRNSTSEPTIQPLPYVTLDAQGNTCVVFPAHASFAKEASPLPPPVPTFRVPPGIIEKAEANPACSSVQSWGQLSRPFPTQTMEKPCIDSTTRPEPIQPGRDFRASFAPGIRIAVPMFGPVPLAMDVGVPVVSCGDSKQACPVGVVEGVRLPTPMMQGVPFSVYSTDPGATFRPFGFLGREGVAPQPVPCHEAVAVPAGYVTPASPETTKRANGCWRLRAREVGAESQKAEPTMSVRCEGADMVCTNLALKWQHNSKVEAVAFKNAVRVRGKDFEAEAEEVEFYEAEGRLVLKGNAWLRRFQDGKCNCSVKADGIVWGPEGVVANSFTSSN